ncbi:MAG: biotin/lipoate A/B protein ligase family protein [Chthoniobacterales bacterium]
MRPLPVLHVYDDAELRSAAMNMAIDEALFEVATAPSIRFYSWRKPSMSFGYFSSYDQVAAQANARELVRRWTGGGIVPHGADLTYTVVLPSRDGEKVPSSRVVYSEIHDAIRIALPMSAALATRDAPKISDACFANPVTADVLVNGEKIAGAAQRRTRAGLLHQGSIQLANLPHAFREAFAAALCHTFEKKDFSPQLLARAEELAAQKYGTNEWLGRR